ncbi:low temperature requirement protein A [Streptomyces sp. NRRL WC-3742]|uniref:low temperature requirement protein A n=1 Tax=Streptomyces sp. NRRL WC-3742 TaxID=1463934 RepID=UPI00068EC527|nr:low temperature requirement protein A [Streptomyces sp. NRRL WC-3742]
MTVPPRTASSAAVPIASAVEPALKVAPLELFLDLVFVFTVTQLTGSLAHHLTPGGLAQVMVMLALIWWMYDAFIWLTNAMPPSTHGRRGLLMLAMGAFLVISLSVPHAFQGSGAAFGWAYLAVVVLHTGMFGAAGVAPESVLRMGAANLALGGLVVTGGYLTGTVQLVFWTAAFAMQYVTQRAARLPAFRLRSDHFVERHGLIMIIAFGESVIAIGVGAGALGLGPSLIAVALLSLSVCVGLWWAYFGHDDDARAEHHMASLSDAERNRAAVLVYYLGHFGLLLGVLLFAAGVKAAVAHPGAASTLPQAAALSGGVALYLVVNAAIRRFFALRPNRARLLGAALVLAAVPLGASVSATDQVGAVAAVLAGVFGYEARRWSVGDFERD